MPVPFLSAALTDAQLAVVAFVVLGGITLWCWLRQMAKPPADTHHYHYHESRIITEEDYDEEEDDSSEAWKQGRQNDEA